MATPLAALGPAPMGPHPVASHFSSRYTMASVARFRIESVSWPWAGLVGLLLVTACGGSAESPAPSDSNDSDAAGDATTNDARQALGFGWCCGKPADCTSKRCVGIGEGPLFCTRSCQAYPDDCPVGYRCEEHVDACIPSAPSYLCEY